MKNRSFLQKINHLFFSLSFIEVIDMVDNDDKCINSGLVSLWIISLAKDNHNEVSLISH